MSRPGGGGHTSPAAPAEAVVAVLRERSQTVATAESLTGGLVGATLTAVPGASAVYRGGLIVYATELKAELGRVAPQTLAADGPVAASTAAQLARGAADVCGADWGLATTGVAGPEAQDGHPVGQVYVAVAGPPAVEVPDRVPDGSPERDGDVVQVQELALAGDRSAIRDQTTRAVLQLLLDRLQAGQPPGPSQSSGLET